jgi:hypothetical protein
MKNSDEHLALGICNKLYNTRPLVKTNALAYLRWRQILQKRVNTLAYLRLRK